MHTISQLLFAILMHNTLITRMWADAQHDGRPAEYSWHPQRKFHNFIPWLMAAARVLCSNVGNIGERKTWTQSKFYNWQNSVTGQQLRKMYI